MIIGLLNHQIILESNIYLISYLYSNNTTARKDVLSMNSHRIHAFFFPGLVDKIPYSLSSRDILTFLFISSGLMKKTNRVFVYPNANRKVDVVVS